MLDIGSVVLMIAGAVLLAPIWYFDKKYERIPLWLIVLLGLGSIAGLYVHGFQAVGSYIQAGIFCLAVTLMDMGMKKKGPSIQIADQMCLILLGGFLLPLYTQIMFVVLVFMMAVAAEYSSKKHIPYMPVVTSAYIATLLIYMVEMMA